MTTRRFATDRESLRAVPAHPDRASQAAIVVWLLATSFLVSTPAAWADNTPSWPRNGIAGDCWRTGTPTMCQTHWAGAGHVVNWYVQNQLDSNAPSAWSNDVSQPC